MRIILFIIVATAVIFIQSLIGGFVSDEEKVACLPTEPKQLEAAVPNPFKNPEKKSTVMRPQLHQDNFYDLAAKRQKVQSLINETRAMIDSELAKRP